MALDEAQAITSLTVLTRLAQRDQDTDAVIRRAIMADPEHMLGPAVEVAVATGAPMPAVLNSILREEDLPLELVRQLRRRIPPQTVSLRKTDALAAEKLVESGETSELEPSLLHEHAERLLETGKTEQALPVAQRALAEAERNRASDPLTLLTALRVLSVCQVAAGQMDDAVATAERGIPLIYDLSRQGVLLPTTAARAYAVLGQRCLSAGDQERAVENLYVAAALCAAYLQKNLPGQPDPSPDAAAHRDLISTETWDSFEAEREEASRLFFVTRPDNRGTIASNLNEILGFASAHLAGALRSQDRNEEALSFALQAEAIFRELKDAAPDEFAHAHAQAMLEARLCINEESPDPGHRAILEMLAPQLPAALSLLSADPARRGDLDSLQSMMSLLVAAARETPRADQVETLNDLIRDAVAHLRAGSLAVARVMLRWGEAFARAFVEPSVDERVALSRVLNALAWAEDDAKIETAVPRAEEAYAIAVDASSLPGADEQLMARQRATTSSGLANRLTNAGRAAEALEAKQRAIEAMALVYDRDKADDVWSASAWLSEAMGVAESRGVLTELTDKTFSFAIDVLEGFATHRDLARVAGFLASMGFLTVTGLARRNDSEATARALDALASLAHRYPNETGIVSAMMLTPLNAIGCHLRTHRLDLSEAALEALAALVAEHPDNAEARIQLAKCGNQLVNAYIDLDVSRAAAAIKIAGAALRSPEYLAILPSLGENDPPGYLEWLDQIEAAGGDQGSTGDQAAEISPEDLERAIADYRATTVGRAAELGPGHPLTIATRLRLALYLELSGDMVSAEAEARQAYEAAVAALGPDDVTTAEALEVWRRCGGS